MLKYSIIVEYPQFLFQVWCVQRFANWIRKIAIFILLILINSIWMSLTGSTVVSLTGFTRCSHSSDTLIWNDSIMHIAGGKQHPIIMPLISLFDLRLSFFLFETTVSIQFINPTQWKANKLSVHHLFNQTELELKWDINFFLHWQPCWQHWYHLMYAVHIVVLVIDCVIAFSSLLRWGFRHGCFRSSHQV